MAKLTKYTKDSIDPLNKIDKIFNEVSNKLEEHRELINDAVGLDPETIVSKDFLQQQLNENNATIINEIANDNTILENITNNVVQEIGNDINIENNNTITNIETDITTLKTDITNINSKNSQQDTKIATLENDIDLKEDKSNKSNIIDQSTTKYSSNKAVYDAVNVLENAMNNFPHPEVLQTTGTSTTNVMSQKAVTDAIASLTNITGILTPRGDVTTEANLPTTAVDGDMYFITDIQVWAFHLQGNWYKLNSSIDLSDYFNKAGTQAAIITITGEKSNLSTTDKSNLVNAINENKTQITINKNNLSALENNVNNIDTRVTTSEGNITALQTQINGINNILVGLEQLLSEV